MAFLHVLALLLSIQADQPRLDTRVFPQLQTLDLNGCRNATHSNVILTAEIKGGENEQWYCPRVEWDLPNGTHAMEESDCDPWEEHGDYPRVFRRPYCAGQDDGHGQVAVVRLSKAGHLVARAEIRFYVQ
jgi:hypothetical protein